MPINPLYRSRCTLWLCLAALAGAGEVLPTPEAQIAALDREVRILAELRDRLRTEAGEIPSARRVTLNLGRFLAWHDRFGNLQRGDLALDLRLGGPQVWAAPARCDTMDRARHAVDATRLVAEDGRLHGELTVRIFDPPRTHRVTVVLTVDIKDGAATGTWQAPMGGMPVIGGNGSVTGALTLISPTWNLPPAPADDPTAEPRESLLIKAVWQERCAERLYQQCRALIAARTLGLPVAHSLQLARVIEAEAPTLKTGDATRRTDAPPPPRIRRPGRKGGAAVDPLADPDDDPPPSAEEDARSEALLDARLAAARSRVERRRSLVEERIAAAPPPPVVGTTPVEDPEFGPWFGGEPLPETPAGGQTLPASPVAEGPQLWPAVTRWTCIGPFPADGPGLDGAGLPDLVPALDGGFRLDARALGVGGKDFEVSEINPAAPGLVEPGTGRIRPPTWARSGKRPWPFPNASFYAVADLAAPTDGEWWFGLTANDAARLWVDGHPIWVAADKDPRQHETAGRIRVALRAGVHQLLVRCDNHLEDTWFSLRICVRGAPRPAAQAEAAITAARAAAAKAGPPTAGTVGWRFDGSGCYPDTQPPLAWDPDSGTNVRWRRPMPFNHATPVIWGDRLFTLEEPHTLVCLDKLSGEERWRADADLAATLPPERRAEADAVRQGAATAQAELARLGTDRPARRAALLTQGLTDEAAVARLKELDRQADAYLAFLDQQVRIITPGWKADVGHAYSTPVTDGRHVYVKSNTGALACFTLDGERRWVVNHGGTCSSNANTSSPLLVDGLVLVFVPQVPAGADKSGPDDPYFLRAYDAVSGEHRWTTRTRGTGDLYCGTPVAVRVSDRTTTMSVAVTPDGSLVRIADGAMLQPYLGAHELYGSPITDGTGLVVMTTAHDKAAWDLVMLDRDTVGARPRWYVDHLGIFQDGNYGLFHDGRLFSSRPLVDVLDLATGDLLWTSGNILWTRPGRGYPPLGLAGGHLYVADNATWFQPTCRPGSLAYPGAMSVLTATVPGVVLARNRIEQVHGGFACDGDRLYLRSMRSLMCLGLTGDAGRRYQAETVAGEVLSQFFPDPPSTDAPLAITAVLPADGRWRVRGTPGGALRAWLWTGPLDPAAVPGAVAALADGAVYRADGPDRLPDGIPLKALVEGNMPEWAEDSPFGTNTVKAGPHLGWGGIMGDRIEVGKLGAAAGKVAILATIIDNPWPQRMRADAGHPQARMWLGGIEVGHNRVVDLPAGAITCVVILALDDPGDRRFLVGPRLWPSAGPQADRDRWQAALSGLRPYLEPAVTLAPDTPAGRRARRILAGLQ
jgi:outer membrane protein assembly factor BamB